MPEDTLPRCSIQKISQISRVMVGYLRLNRCIERCLRQPEGIGTASHGLLLRVQAGQRGDFGIRRIVVPGVALVLH